MMRLLLAASLATALSPSGLCAADLFRDDFSRFPPGWLTNPVGSLNAAIQEYHYLPHRGVPHWRLVERHFHPLDGGDKIYAPVRNPDYNESNYRTNVSLPNWEPVHVKK